MEELFRLLQKLGDTSDITTLSRLERWFDEQRIIVTGIRKQAEYHLQRSAQLSANLAAWRAAQGPRIRERNADVLRLRRRGLSDAAIGARVGLSARQVRRIIRQLK